MKKRLKKKLKEIGVAHIGLLLGFLEWVEARLPGDESPETEVTPDPQPSPVPEVPFKIKGSPLSEVFEGFPILAKFPSLKPELALGHILGVANFSGNCLTVEFHPEFPPSRDLIENILLEGFPLNPSCVQLRIEDSTRVNLYFASRSNKL